VDLQDKSEEFLNLYARANPLPNARAKVPLLQIGMDRNGADEESDTSVLLCESLIVAEYIAESFAPPDAKTADDGDGGLLPTRAADRATMRLFTELCAPNFSYFPLIRAQGTDDAESKLQTFKDGLVSVDAFLAKAGCGADDGPFLFGTRFSLAECNAAPFVTRCCAILPAFTGGDDGDLVVDPIEICDELGLVRLKEWIEAVVSRPSVVATSVPKEDMLKSTSQMLERFASMGK